MVINYSVILTICIKPSVCALGQPLRKRSPASDQMYPKIPRRRRGKQRHHGGDVCGLVVLGSMVLSVLFLPYKSYGARVFVPAETQIVVKLLKKTENCTIIH
jgi:hypothetical protein